MGISTAPSNSFYGLVAQKGPWQQTPMDELRHGSYDADNSTTESPYQINGSMSLPTETYAHSGIIDNNPDFEFDLKKRRLVKRKTATLIGGKVANLDPVTGRELSDEEFARREAFHNVQRINPLMPGNIDTRAWNIWRQIRVRLREEAESGGDTFMTDEAEQRSQMGGVPGGRGGQPEASGVPIPTGSRDPDDTPMPGPDTTGGVDEVDPEDQIARAA